MKGKLVTYMDRMVLIMTQQRSTLSMRSLASIYIMTSILFMVFPLPRTHAFSFSSSKSSQTPSSLSSSSPWAPATWSLTLDFGRRSSSSSSTTSDVKTTTSSSSMTQTLAAGMLPPTPDYGKSGSHLVVRGMVVVESTDVVVGGAEVDGAGVGSSDDMGKAKALDSFMGRGACVIRPVTKEDERTLPSLISSSSSSSSSSSFSYVNARGQQRVELSTGGWTLEFPTTTTTATNKEKCRATKVRFYMDLMNDIERNDVILPAGTRLYFMANSWRENDFDLGRTIMGPIQEQLEQSQRRLVGQVSHETGDRRLDGTDMIETIQAYRDMARLVADRDMKLAQWREAMQYYPSSDDLPEGPWPGSTEWLTLSEDNPIFILQPKGSTATTTTTTTKTSAVGWQSLLQLVPWGGPDSYCLVGTWTARAVVADDVWQDD